MSTTMTAVAKPRPEQAQDIHPTADDESSISSDRGKIVAEAGKLENQIVRDTGSLIDRNDKLADWCAIGRKVLRLANLRKQLAGRVNVTGAWLWRGSGKNNNWTALHEGLRFKVQETTQIPDSLRMDTCAKMACWVDLMLSSGLPADKLSYHTVVNGFMPAFTFDPQDIAGAVTPGYEIWTAEMVSRLAGPNPPSPAYVSASRLARAEEIAKERLDKSDPEKRIEAERDALVTKQVAKVRTAKNRIADAVQAALTETDLGIKPVDVMATIIQASNDAQRPVTRLTSGFIADPSKATEEDMRRLVNALNESGNLKAINALHELTSETLATFRKAASENPPTAEELKAIAA